jgi:hypothetical protein
MFVERWLIKPIKLRRSDMFVFDRAAPPGLMACYLSRWPTNISPLWGWNVCRSSFYKHFAPTGLRLGELPFDPIEQITVVVFDFESI